MCLVVDASGVCVLTPLLAWGVVDEIAEDVGRHAVAHRVEYVTAADAGELAAMDASPAQCSVIPDDAL